jgi:hypothetical protein
MFAVPTDTSFREELAALERFVEDLEPGRYRPADVPVVLQRIARAEKLCGAAKLLMSKRAASIRSDERDGRTSAAKWIAEQSGDAVGKARRDLETADRLASQPALESALRAGDVSPAQASVLLPALEVDPEATCELIGAAQTDSFNELRQHCQSVIAAKRSEEEATEREARLRARRHLHIGTTDDGAISFRGELPPVEGAIVKNALESMKRTIFEEARRQQRRESHEAYMADALVALCASGGTAGAARDKRDSSAGTPRAEIVLHVSAEALRRGELEAGERCEIEGVGPVALSTVEYLFGNSWAKLVIEKGVDIASVTHFGRWIPAHLETALSRRDRVCAVPGCGITYGLERDHIIPVEEGGPTELANLVKLCKRHHFLKTHKFWRLIGGPGEWEWVNIRPQQETVADGDYLDVAAPGQPTAGLARPLLRPNAPLGDPEPDLVEPATSKSLPTQQTFACRSAGTVLVMRITPRVLASLRRSTKRPFEERPRSTGGNPVTTATSLEAVRSVTTAYPLVEMGSLVADPGLVAVAGEDSSVRRQGEQPGPNRPDNRREVRPAAPGGARASPEQRVAREQHMPLAVVEAAPARGVPRRVDDRERDGTRPEHLAVDEIAVRRRAIGAVHLTPQWQVCGMQEHRRSERVPQLDRGVDVVVVPMCRDDGDSTAVADSRRYGRSRVRRIDDEDFGLVADYPDVVLDLEVLAVQ